MAVHPRSSTGLDPVCKTEAWSLLFAFPAGSLIWLLVHPDASWDLRAPGELAYVAPDFLSCGFREKPSSLPLSSGNPWGVMFSCLPGHLRPCSPMAGARHAGGRPLRHASQAASAAGCVVPGQVPAFSLIPAGDVHPPEKQTAVFFPESLSYFCISGCGT